MFRIGLMGLGAIGEQVAAAIAAGVLPEVKIASALVRRPRSEKSAFLVTNDPDAFFEVEVDAFVEGAGHQAVRDHAERALKLADMMVTSVGALTDDALRERLIATAKANGHRLILPSAGIGALDTLSAAAIGGLDEVVMTVRKQPSAWFGTEAEKMVDLNALTAPFTVYEGPVREGARRYPQNVNISAAVALAGAGLDKTHLKIVADPTITTHVIEVRARGAFGSFTFVEDILPTESNPKTGMIVGMAIVKAVRQLSSPLVIGL
ncbi:MAG: aspartate dehydrogenase [Alphaproteobacteria bacterium]|nr:aspartate dehydrogenase [Alphaproteobacteria bacterium]